MECPNCKELASAIVSEMKDAGHALWIDPEMHAEQHAFIAVMIQEHHERAARRKRIAEMIAGSVLLAGLFTILGLLGAGVLSWLRNPS